jgi:hypothetical protein
MALSIGNDAAESSRLSVHAQRTTFFKSFRRAYAWDILFLPRQLSVPSR